MPRNVEMRERVGNVFNHADSLLYPKTHISMVEGLLTNGKLTLSLLPEAVKKGMKFLTIITTTTSNTATVLTTIDSALLSAQLDPAIEQSVRYGGYVIANVDTVLTVSAGHKIQISDDGAGEVAAGSTVNMERGDWLVYAYWDTTSSLHTWNIINNTHGLATTSAMGLMSSSDKAKLDGIAANANNYAHPTYTARTIDTDGIEVLDTFTSDTGGHITGIAKRTLPNASQTVPGVMTAADKTKLDGIAINATANVGTVTSVAASSGTGISVTGSPITSSGTLTITNTAPNATHTGDVTGSGALTITDNVVTNTKLADMAAFTFKARGLGTAGDPQDITAADARSILNVADGANNYIHPAYTPRSLDLGTNETIDVLTVDALGAVTNATKQTIRTGSTTQTGLLQLATGAELTTATEASKAVSPVSVKTMIDYFAGMKRYADLTAANAATHPDGTIVLVTVA